MTTLFMQFDRTFSQISMSQGGGAEVAPPPVCMFGAAGRFVDDCRVSWEMGQDTDILTPDGLVTLELFFGVEGQRFHSDKAKAFWLDHLDEKTVECGAGLQIAQLPWFLRILDDCARENHRLTCTFEMHDPQDGGAWQPRDRFDLLARPQRLHFT